MNPNAAHILETIHQRNHVEHVVAVNGYSVHLGNGYAMIDGLCVTDYYCAPCYWDAARRGDATETTGEGSCIHKDTVVEARRIVEQEAR